MVEPSEHYKRCLEEAKRHQATSKTYSGSLVRPHAPFIKQIIQDLGIKSILDYGAGKGTQYNWVMPKRQMTLEEYWGMPVRKYDPAWPPYADEPKGTFDLVICTHTLGAIPKTDHGWVVDRLYNLSNKAVYVAEMIGPVKKKVFSQPQFMPVGYTAENWRETLGRKNSGRDVWLSIKHKLEEGQPISHTKQDQDGNWSEYRWPEGVKAFDHETA